MNEVKIVNKLWVMFLVSILLVGCGGFRSSRNLIPVPTEEETVLKRTKGVAMTKGNIFVVAVPLQDVKELDGFGIIIVNETPNWISVKQEECMLVQNGKVIYPLENKRAFARLGAGYKPKMPDLLSSDIFEWRKDVNSKNSKGSKFSDEDKKLLIVTGSRESMYLYFSTQGNIAPMQLIIPSIYNETTKERTNFSFKFEVQKK